MTPRDLELLDPVEQALMVGADMPLTPLEQALVRALVAIVVRELRADQVKAGT